MVIGWLTIDRVLFGDWFEGSIFVLPEHDPLRELGEEFHGPLEFVIARVQGAGGLSRRGRRRWSRGSCT